MLSSKTTSFFKEISVFSATMAIFSCQNIPGTLFFSLDSFSKPGIFPGCRLVFLLTKSCQFVTQFFTFRIKEFFSLNSYRHFKTIFLCLAFFQVDGAFLLTTFSRPSFSKPGIFPASVTILAHTGTLFFSLNFSRPSFSKPGLFQVASRIFD